MSDEIWRPIPGFGGRYEASTKGGIRSLYQYRSGRYELRREPKMLKLSKQGSAPVVTLGSQKKNSRVPPLILETFVCPRPSGYVAICKDGDDWNLSVGNLAWVRRGSDHGYKRNRIREGNAPDPATALFADSIYRSELARRMEGGDRFDKMVALGAHRPRLSRTGPNNREVVRP